MKRIFSITLKIVFSVSFLSCDDYLDVNTDPLAATEGNANAVLPFVFTEYSARKTTELGTRINDVYHHYSSTFNSPVRGSVSSFLTGNTWGVWYGGLLGNLVLIEQDAIAAGETSNNVNAVAKIMKGHLFFELTSMWGDVPFTQALNGVEFPEPAFDDQRTVLVGVVNIMDEAIALIDAMPTEGNFDFSSGDLIFGGNITLWRELANSIKIRTLMLIRNVEPGFADPLLQKAFAEPTVSRDVFLKYEGSSSATNGLYDIVQQFFGPSNEDANVFGPAPAMIDQLRGTNDPRLDLWVVDKIGGYPATYNQLPIDNGKHTVWSDNLLRATHPDIYFMPSEIFLYKAELILKGVLVGSAQTEFENGVRYAVNYWGKNVDGFQGTAVTTTQVDAFITGLGAVTLEKIHEQLWLEAMHRPIIAWNTVRRTSVPALEPPPGVNIKTILKRFDYPPDEVGANPNTPKNPATDTPMWFENL